MNKELIQKIIRCFVITLCFVGMLTAIGMKEREVQQWGFMLGLMVIFGLLLRNIWLTLFMGWTVFLFAFFKFEVGLVYVTNIFFGCLLYYLVKVAFKKEHINFFVNAVLWFAAINITYMILQISGFEFVYNTTGLNTRNISPAGFMGQTGIMGAFLALCVPLLASRTSKMAMIGALGLFIPLFICRSTMGLLAGGVGLLFVLWYKLPKKLWICMVLVIIGLCVFHCYKIKPPKYSVDIRTSMWKNALNACIRHPITGWGLDSFRNVTSYKKFTYISANELWDNPHNLLITLFFEFGVFGLFLLGGYLRQCGIWFSRAVKEPNVIGLFGFIIVTMLISQANFIMFVPRTAGIIIIAVALFEIATKDNA